MTTLNGKIAIVTGAAAGFGAAIATLYVKEGAKVILADIAVEAGTSLAQKLGTSAHFVTCDVSNKAHIDAALQTCIKHFGVPDIVVNNAGMTHNNQSMLSVEESMFDKIFAVNVKSIYYMTQAVVPHMIERGEGVILNVGSTAGIRPRPGLTWYNASKGAVNLLSKSMAVELGGHGIRVNAICPVIGETAMLQQFMGQPDTPENRAKFIATIPLGRLSRPSDVAAVAHFLATDSAEFISGIEFPVDGARTV
jgi:3-oxoacyl-[acyl-carrier protein] reductase